MVVSLILEPDHLDGCGFYGSNVMGIWNLSHPLHRFTPPLIALPFRITKLLIRSHRVLDSIWQAVESPTPEILSFYMRASGEQRTKHQSQHLTHSVTHHDVITKRSSSNCRPNHESCRACRSPAFSPGRGNQPYIALCHACPRSDPPIMKRKDSSFCAELMLTKVASSNLPQNNFSHCAWFIFTVTPLL